MACMRQTRLRAARPSSKPPVSGATASTSLGWRDRSSPAIGSGTKWDFQTVNQLFTEIKTRMPRNNPATLGDDTYLDFVDYILQANAFPPGTEALTRDSAVLSGLIFKRRRAPSPPNWRRDRWSRWSGAFHKKVRTGC